MELITAPAFKIPNHTGRNGSQLGIITLTDSPGSTPRAIRPLATRLDVGVDLSVADPRVVAELEQVTVRVAFGALAQDLGQHPLGRVLLGVPVAPLGHSWPLARSRR